MRCAWVLFFSIFMAGPALGAEQAGIVVPVGEDGVQRVSVVATEYSFSPNHIVVRANVPVVISVRKEPSIVPHSFVIQAAEAGVEVRESLSAEPKEITFTPRLPGKYTFFCDKKLIFSKSHREKGMEGVLEVLP